MNTPPWRCHLLGPARLYGPRGEEVVLERKLAACLTYLALEGPTPRGRLVGLLWPDSPEGTARNNLSQMLRKLRLMTGTDLIQGGDPLQLAEVLAVDALALSDDIARGQHEALIAAESELLAGLGYDDCPDLSEWIAAERERLLEWRALAVRAELTRTERAGDFAQALTLARALLDLDPVSEDAWRHVMRLHYLRGDRPAALRTYHKCQEVLKREFDVDPLPETVQLARDIDAGTVPTGAKASAAQLPLSVLRPPHLLGREAEWARMEEAWARGQMIYVTGDAGVGKSRLAFDFAVGKGAFLEFKGRPGDTHQPFTTSARNYRISLERTPNVVIEPWVRRELGRVLPEFAPQDEVLEPLGSNADLLRYRQAMLEVVRATWRDVRTIIADDLQLYDHPSTRDGFFFFAVAHDHPQSFPRVIGTFRRGELVPEMQQDVEDAVRQGVAILVDLAPLDPATTDALMTDLGVPPDAALRERLSRYSGGSPLFLLEIVKHLIEGGALGGQSGDFSNLALPITQKVGEVISRRLTRLSAPALQAARAASVLQSDFDIEMVAEVLGAPILDVAVAWDELEAAQIVRGNNFWHDLVYEAVRAEIPLSVRTLLHRRAAHTLERAGQGAARVARHWLEGGRGELAAPLFLQAARDAEDRFQLAESAQFYAQAGQLLASLGRDREANEALTARARLEARQEAAGTLG